MLRKLTHIIYQWHDWWEANRPNKYVLTFILVLLWIAFFDKNRWITQFQLQKTINKYELEQQSIKSGIIDSRSKMKDIRQDREKFGREQYYMARPNEDVYIIED